MTEVARARLDLRAVPILVLAAFVAGGLAAVATATPRDDAAPVTAVLTYDDDGFRYTYHVLTGDESLFDFRADPRELHDLSKNRPELTLKLRHALESKLHVDRLDALQRDKGDAIRTLRSLGYL